jgi:hypothetical protein
VWHPSKLRCFFVPLTLTTAYSARTFGVILPGFDDGAESVYERWKTVESLEELNACKVVPVPADHRLITDPMEVGTPHDIFKYVIERKQDEG